MINFSSSFKLSVIGYLPHPKLSKHHINDIIIWSNQTEGRLSTNFYSKVYFEEENKI